MIDKSCLYVWDYVRMINKDLKRNGQKLKNEKFSDPIAAREEAIMSNIRRDNEKKLFTCALCEFGASSRHKAFCHIEAKHFQDSPVTYSCQFCGKFVSSKNALGIHITRNHKEERLNARNVT